MSCARGRTLTSTASDPVRSIVVPGPNVRIRGPLLYSGRRGRSSSPDWHNDYRHSDSGFDTRRGIRRGFLPRGLSDTCPQASAARRIAAHAGRCPTTLNTSGRSARAVVDSIRLLSRHPAERTTRQFADYCRRREARRCLANTARQCLAGASASRPRQPGNQISKGTTFPCHCGFAT